MTEPTVEPDPTPADRMRDLGFDPEQVKAVILTPTSTVAIAADYPEPHVPPEEAD